MRLGAARAEQNERASEARKKPIHSKREHSQGEQRIPTQVDTPARPPVHRKTKAPCPDDTLCAAKRQLAQECLVLFILRGGLPQVWPTWGAKRAAAGRSFNTADLPSVPTHRQKTQAFSLVRSLGVSMHTLCDLAGVVKIIDPPKTGSLRIMRLVGILSCCDFCCLKNILLLQKARFKDLSIPFAGRLMMLRSRVVLMYCKAETHLLGGSHSILGSTVEHPQGKARFLHLASSSFLWQCA